MQNGIKWQYCHCYCSRNSYSVSCGKEQKDKFCAIIQVFPANLSNSVKLLYKQLHPRLILCPHKRKAKLSHIYKVKVDLLIERSLRIWEQCLYCIVFSRQKTEKSTKSLASETNSMLKQLNYLETDDPSEQVKLAKTRLDQTWITFSHSMWVVYCTLRSLF